MIGTYSTNFGDASAFAEMLRAEGLQVEYRRLFFGCATAVAGKKPEALPVSDKLRGGVLRYDRPTDPVADDEWDAAN